MTVFQARNPGFRLQPGRNDLVRHDYYYNRRRSTGKLHNCIKPEQEQLTEHHASQEVQMNDTSLTHDRSSKIR